MSLQQALQQQETEQTSLDEALVIGCGNENWIIQSSSGTYKAKKAVSCLVCPEIGDKVLSVSLASGGSNILAILERKQSQTTHLKFEGDVDISSTQSIRMLASKRLDAFSAGKINLNSNELTIQSNLSSILFDKLSVTGGEAVHSINKVRVLAKYIETVSETSKLVVKNSFRLVSGLESVSAGEMIQRIKKRFTVQSKQVSMLAEDDAKLNGKRVHLG